MLSAEDFERFVKIAKANNIHTMKLEGLELSFHIEPQPILVPAQVPNTEGMPTDDQMMLWSTGFMPDHKKGEES